MFARSDHPRTSGTYRRQDDVFGYELQVLLSGVLQVFQNLGYKIQRRLSVVLLIYQSHRHFTSNGTGQFQNGSSNLLSPYRDQPRSSRNVVVYPWPVFSAPKRTNHTPISFDQQAQVSRGHTSCKKKENCNTE
ncbi:unnamed protein product, partial [Ascophyllum nodosum]